MLIQRNKQLDTFLANILAAYTQLYNILDSLVQAHKISLVGTFGEAKGRNVVRQYLNKLK